MTTDKIKDKELRDNIIVFDTRHDLNLANKMVEKTRQATADGILNKVKRIKYIRKEKGKEGIFYLVPIESFEELKKKFVPDSLKPQRGFKEDKK